MDDDTRRWAALILTVIGLGWFFRVEIIRGNSRDDSHRMFWLHLTAPVVAIVCMGIALWLLLGMERFRR